MGSYIFKNATKQPLKPLYIFSLPRAGSTLLQRLLATHPDIATAAEPWLLLPYFYSSRTKGICAEYSHEVAVAALSDFISGLPQGDACYTRELHDFVMRLYAKAAGREVTYFLDKTPRYHLIVNDVIRVFPEGRFIFLWRNPLAVIASIVETWGGGEWNLYRYDVDLLDGVANMLEAYRKYQDCVHAVRYEDLLADPGAVLPGLFRYLGLDVHGDASSSFSNVRLRGRMGDPTGTTRYTSLNREPLEKWKSVLATPLRKQWCRRYLNTIGSENLSLMGYDLQILLNDLDDIPSNPIMIFSDIMNMSRGVIRRELRKRLMGFG
jgi:hypothetical protein